MDRCTGLQYTYQKPYFLKPKQFKISCLYTMSIYIIFFNDSWQLRPINHYKFVNNYIYIQFTSQTFHIQWDSYIFSNAWRHSIIFTTNKNCKYTVETHSRTGNRSWVWLRERAAKKCHPYRHPSFSLGYFHSYPFFKPLTYQFLWYSYRFIKFTKYERAWTKSKKPLWNSSITLSQSHKF